MKIEIKNLVRSCAAVLPNKQLIMIFFPVVVASFWGCDNYVDVGLPNSQLSSQNVFEDKTTANAAMLQVYANMRDQGIFTGYSFGASSLLGLYGDEFDYYGVPQTAGETFYKNSVLSSTDEIKSMWGSSYNQIYGANAVLEGVRSSTSLSQTDKNILVGEALFSRALIHFYLTNLFGSIPYIKTTEYKANTIIGKENTQAVYLNCIEDLEDASLLLPEAYSTPDRTRPNRLAARAMLAKIYLYTGQWDLSSNEASAIINNSALYAPETDLDKIFLAQSTTTIWQFAPSSNGQNTREAQTFIFTVGPPPSIALTSTLVNAFETGDQRKTKWISAVSTPDKTWYYPSKYKNRSSTTSTECSIIIRLAEMHLVRAEARAQRGDFIGSKEDINVIRNTAGLGNTTAATRTELLDAVLKENQLEFFTEIGHRFFDLKRFNKLDAVLSLSKPGWDSFENTLPLPASELLLNNNLNPQNTGY